MPQALEPQAYWCFFAHCDITVQSQLTSYAAASNGYFVAAGTDSGLYCTAGCGSASYYGWYELYPNAAVKCTIPMNPFDNVVTEVINEGLHGQDTTKYDFYVNDFTNQKSCSVSGQSFPQMGLPYFASTLMERPSIGGSFARLPRFTQVSTTGYTNYNGNWHNYNELYNNGWYSLYNMVNGGTLNIQVSSVDSYNYYSQTWLTSNGT